MSSGWSLCLLYLRINFCTGNSICIYLFMHVQSLEVGAIEILRVDF